MEELDTAMLKSTNADIVIRTSKYEKCQNFYIKVDPFSPVFVETQKLLNKIVGLAIGSSFWSPIWQGDVSLQ